MGVDESCEVDLSSLAEQQAPEIQHQGRAHEDIWKFECCRRSEFSGSDASRDNLPQSLEEGPHEFFIVSIDELGKAGAFGDQESQNFSWHVVFCNPVVEKADQGS